MEGQELEKFFENIREEVHGGGDSALVEFIGLQGQSSRIGYFLMKKMGFLQGFLVSGERNRNQRLKSLIIVQGVECDQSLSENLLRITSRRSSEKIQNLRCNFLGFKKQLYYITYPKLSIHLGKPNLCSFRPESRCNVQISTYILENKSES